MTELYAWGLHPSAGYYKHPPLGALIVGAWFQLFPPSDLNFHLLAMCNAALALYAVDLIGRRYLTGDKRIVALLFLLLTPFFQFHAQRFASNQTLLSTWPIATFCFLRAYQTCREYRGLVWAAAAGLAAALAMLGKYYSIFLIVSFALAAVMHPRRLEYLGSPSPGISIVVGGLVLVPHVEWLFANDFLPFSYAMAVHGGETLAYVLYKDFVYLIEGVAYVGVLLAIYWIAVRPDKATLRETFWPADPDGQMLVVLLAVPLILPAIVAPFISAVLTPLWTMSAWFLLPIILLRPAAAKLTRVSAIRITALIVAITIGALAAAPWLAWRYHVESGSNDREYYRAVAAQISDAWHMANARPLQIVMGAYDLVAAVTFYSLDHPDSVPNFDLKAAPWVTSDRLQREGWAAVCLADDQGCLDEARRLSEGKTDVQYINFATTSRYLGYAGRLARFTFVLIGPQPLPRVPVR